ncbi:hypothetical protein GWK47_044693 [Chionoecetes opilio]|uniref:Uncharacterized protein n=1 Tax=Chionoecetes opilio TaxID=41210 RepID=A0A8J5CV59_CHIOP|nr:hypothetical protein GWK47_044693 [Chionoecetes opilio]
MTSMHLRGTRGCGTTACTATTNSQQQLMTSLDFVDDGFQNIILEGTVDTLRIRTNAMNEEEALRWKDVFCKKNNVCFSHKNVYTPKRNTYHKKFQCMHGDKRHKGVKKTFTGCSVRMDIKIKLITVNTIRKDPQVKSHPCMISINGEHNHNQNTASLRELRVLPQTKEEFYKYLEAGELTPYCDVRA